MELDKLPSVLTENKFNEKGLVETDSGLLVPVYVASECGFNKFYKRALDQFYEELRKEAGVLALCPFTACAEYLGPPPSEERPLREHKEYWQNFNKTLGKVNYETLMPRSKFMIAIMEGAHIDDGVAAETAYFPQYHGPVIGIRSDFRLSENLAAPINGAVRYFVDTGEKYDGEFFDGPDAYEKAFPAIKKLADRIRDSS